jgi:hypothetical protein
MTRFAASVLICLLWAVPGWAAGLSYRLEPKLIAPDTYVFEGAVEHFTLKNGGNILNTGFIVTEAGVVVIQTGPSRRYGEEMRAAIAKVTERPILKVFVSNQHPDYFLGSQLDFAGLGRIAGDVYQAVEQAIGIFCTLPVMR